MKQTMKLYYTTKEIAEMFSVSKDTVLGWVIRGLPFLDARDGRIRTYDETCYESRYCNMRRFKPSDIEEWMKNRSK